MTVRLLSLPWLEPRQAPLGLAIVQRHISDIPVNSKTYHPNIDFHLWITERYGPAAAEFAYSHDEVGEIICGLLWRALSSTDFSRARTRGDILRTIAGLDLSPADDSMPVIEDALEASNFPREFFWALANEFRTFTADYFRRYFIEQCEVVGFTLTIAQTAASLAWAKIIKVLAPDVIVVMGGSQCEDPMGLALFDAVPDIDIMVRGEADASLTPLFTALHESNIHHPIDLSGIPNLAWRDRMGTAHSTRQMATSMSDAKFPDYGDFRAAYKIFSSITGIPANFYVEGSRGCWWGERRQCTFCGIHSNAIAFRQKSAGEVLKEVERILREQRTSRVVFADSIMSNEHMSDLLPALEQLTDRYNVEFLTDVKNNLRKENIYALARAGFAMLQIGIESFSSNLLKRMEKGNSALQHIRAIKWCAEAGIFPYYHILTHVIGESVEDYEISLKYATAISHLPPPSGVFPIELNRYAPYFEQWKSLGFDRPKPALFYAAMFGDSAPNLEEFAYRFRGQHPSTLTEELEAARTELSDYVKREWPSRYDENSFLYRVGLDHVEILRRGRDPLNLLLEGPQADLFLALDGIRAKSGLLRDFSGKLNDEELSRLLGEWEDSGVALSEGGRYLALPVRELRLRPPHVMTSMPTLSATRA
ncbi:RiPP maturation radical SAM C-methyltransferase [Nocardia vinacea]|uniref:RiPP maturation radical SAM C-methyltransferase n=1 Tax=Nocardia vinacea TaxID=96468 RepID=UPI0002DDA5EF|nr:RiPP maturation radical SAM C-methyltransferase [Nocardia vinacea]